MCSKISKEGTESQQKHPPSNKVQNCANQGGETIEREERWLTIVNDP